MARLYDIAERMKNGKEKPKVRLDETHEYQINTGKNAVLMIHAIADDKDKNEFEMMDAMFEVALGSEASKYIAEQDFPVPVLAMISNTIMAAIADVSLEDAEKMAKEEARRQSK